MQPHPPGTQLQMVQRAVQATTPDSVRVVTRDASVATLSWQELKSEVLPELRACAREDVLEEFEHRVSLSQRIS